jgi:hypothetical protein
MRPSTFKKSMAKQILETGPMDEVNNYHYLILSLSQVLQKVLSVQLTEFLVCKFRSLAAKVKIYVGYHLCQLVKTDLCFRDCLCPHHQDLM